MIKLKPAPILNLGAPGSGKTTALITVLADPDLKLVYLSTDPNGEQSLLHALTEVYSIPESKWQGRVFAHTVEPGAADWETLLEVSETINNKSYQGLSQESGIQKAGFRQYIDLINVCKNFTCSWTGTCLGDLTFLKPGHVLAFDGLSGLSAMARDLTIGAKPSLHEGEWNVAMNTVERFIRSLFKLRCPVIVLAHIERETDQVSGTSKIMASTLGKKLAPKLAGMGFGEIIYSYKEGSNYFWSNLGGEVDTKKVILENGGKIFQSYKPFFRYWKTNMEADIKQN